MTSRTGRTATRQTKTVETAVRDQLAVVGEMLARDPAQAENEELPAQVAALTASICGSDADAARLLARFYLRSMNAEKQRDECIRAIRKLKEDKPEFVQVLSRPFPLNGNGRLFVYCREYRESAPVMPYEVVDLPSGEPAPALKAPLPAPPYMGLVLSVPRAFLGPVHAQPLPGPSEIRAVVAAFPESENGRLSELELASAAGQHDRRDIVVASRELAERVKARLDEGEAVHVRVQAGEATALHTSEARKNEDYEEEVSWDGPKLEEMVFPAWLHDLWRRDATFLVSGLQSGSGYQILVALIGPTGTGKSEGVSRCLRTAGAMARAQGLNPPGLKLLRVTRGSIGSPYVDQAEINMRRVFKRAKSLSRKGFLTAILLDEGDMYLGEMQNGLEHSHERSQRLELQGLLSEPLPPGCAVFLTMNPRRTSFLSSPIGGRFDRRPYPRATRSQIAAVAKYYIARRPKALDKVGMSADEFGAALADSLFSDQRVIALGTLHSGKEFFIRARDLQTMSPGKIKSLVENWANEIDVGFSDSIESLWKRLDREFNAVDLTAHNLFDLTFLSESRDDAVRLVKPVTAEDLSRGMRGRV